VAAVYQYLLGRTLTNQEVADVAAAALKATPDGKVRADKDKVAARVLEAAIIARGAQTDSALIGLLLPAVTTVNSSLVASKQLTAAGKEAVIGKAIRATSGLGATIAAQSNALAQAATGTTPNLKRKTFTIAALKTLVFKPQVYDPALASTSQATENTKGPLVQLNNGAPEAVTGQPLYTNHGVPPSIAGVRDYIDALLDLYIPQPPCRPPSATSPVPRACMCRRCPGPSPHRTSSTPRPAAGSWPPPSAWATGRTGPPAR
jgi:hypothetical protein